MAATSSLTPRIAVVGASGHTGGFVVEELLARGLAPVAIGRDPDRLAARGFVRRGVPTRVVASYDPAALDTALSGVGAVINLAGPFLDTADHVAAAAVRVGVHYLDVTAEQASAGATLATFDEPARRAGVSVIPAMGFFGGLADLLCTAATSGWDRVDEVRIAIALDSWHPTDGTRRTGQRNTGVRQVIDGGVLAPVGHPVPTTTLEFGPPFGPQPVTEVPFSEVPLIVRHLHVERLHTWLADTALRDLRDPATPPPVPVDDSGRSAQRFLVEVVVSNADGRRRATAQGQDIYAVTAPLVVEAAARLVAGGHTEPGALAPGAAFDATDFLGSFPRDVLAVDVTDL